MDMGQLSAIDFTPPVSMGTLWALIFTLGLQHCRQSAGGDFLLWRVRFHEPELLSVDEENDASDGIASLYLMKAESW